MRVAANYMPQASFLYFADNANCPYGDKKEELITLAERGVSFLRKEGADVILIACNTLTAAACDILRKKIDVPLLGIEPAVAPALRSGAKKVGVLATRRTQAAIENKYSNIDFIPTGELAFAVERAFPNIGCRLVEKQAGDVSGYDALVLGCTHYVFLAPIFQKMSNAKIYDGNEGLCRYARNRFYRAQAGINAAEARIVTTGGGEQRYYEIWRHILQNG